MCDRGTHYNIATRGIVVKWLEIACYWQHLLNAQEERASQKKGKDRLPVTCFVNFFNVIRYML